MIYPTYNRGYISILSPISCYVIVSSRQPLLIPGMLQLGQQDEINGSGNAKEMGGVQEKGIPGIPQWLESLFHVPGTSENHMDDDWGLLP